MGRQNPALVYVLPPGSQAAVKHEIPAPMEGGSPVSALDSGDSTLGHYGFAFPLTAGYFVFEILAQIGRDRCQAAQIA